MLADRLAPPGGGSAGRGSGGGADREGGVRWKVKASGEGDGVWWMKQVTRGLGGGRRGCLTV